MQKWWAFAMVAGVVLLGTPARADSTTLVQCMDAHENAQRAQKNGHLVFAQKLFQECSAAECPKALRNDCVEGQGSVERATPTVTIVVRDASGADVASAIKVDGMPLTGESGKATPMDPGPHKVQYVVGDKTLLSSFTLVEGEKSRVIALPASDQPAPAPVAAPAPAPAAPAAKDDPSPSRSYLIGPAVLAGAGVLTLIACTGAFAASHGEANDRDDQLLIANDTTKSVTERNNANRSAQSHDDAAGNDRTIALVLGASAVVLIGGAVAWYFFGKPATHKAARFSPVITF